MPCVTLTYIYVHSVINAHKPLFFKKNLISIQGLMLQRLHEDCTRGPSGIMPPWALELMPPKLPAHYGIAMWWKNDTRVSPPVQTGGN